MTGCNPYAPVIGTTFTRLDAYHGTQVDDVPIILGGGTLRGLKLVREKQSDSVRGYYVHASIVFPDNFPVRTIAFDGGSEKVVLTGSSTLIDVKARSHGVFYNTLGVFAITPDQIRRIADFEEVIVTVSGAIDLPAVRLGPKGTAALDAFRETFVDRDGVGENVTRSSVRTTD